MIDPCSLEGKTLLLVHEAMARIKAAVLPVPDSEMVGLNSALGRVLAEGVVSPINIPYDRNSAMDGYALTSRDIAVNQPATLALVGTSWAGKPYSGKVETGQCVRIFTGAVVPEGADTVVTQEQVKADGTNIIFPANLPLFQNIREAGEDIASGGLVCPKHKKLSPADLGLLAAAGVREVLVIRKLNIAFFSTGDELISLGQAPETGKIYDSNRYTLAGLLAGPCYNVVDLGAIPDDKALLEACIMQATATNDVIITTGGASVGDADYIQEILAACGEVKFWKIAIKPGKPLAFGKIGECYFFGLPGNPVAVMVTFQQFVAPSLNLLSGATASNPLRLLATCASNLKKAPGRQEYQRGILSQDKDGNFLVVSAGHQGSHILSSMSRANCYILFPLESKGINSGEKVWVEPFGVLL